MGGLQPEPSYANPGAVKAGPVGELLLVAFVSLLFTLPIWIATHPPMADYPQHLAIASILRWYHDPARHLTETYTLALTRPNTAFVFLTAALSYLMPLALAGKVVVAAAVATTGIAGLALARRAGRPGWYGLFALISAYNFSFFFGFVNNVIAAPLLLYGIVLADRTLDEPANVRAWLTLAVYGCAFYFVHLEFLFLFVGTLGWLGLTRRRSWSDWLALCSSQGVAVAMTLLYYFLRHEENYGYHEKNIFSDAHAPTLIFDKLVEIPQHLFGVLAGGKHFLLFAMAVVAALLAVHARLPRLGERHESTKHGRLGTSLVFLWRRRFLSLGLWFLAAYFLLPHIFVGAFVYQRLIAVAWLVLPAVLPVPDGRGIRKSQLVLAGTIAVQIFINVDAASTFDAETRAGHVLIAKTSPGKSLMAVMLWLGSAGIQDPPLFLHFGSHYLAEKGGRVFFSFSELHISPAQLRPELAFDDQDAMMNEWQPLNFRFPDFGYHYDYFLCHGDFARLARTFGHGMADLAWEIKDDWILLWRRSQPGLAH